MVTGFLMAMVLILSCVVGVLAFSNARLWVELKAMQNSTHNIQFMDPAELIRKQNAEEAERGNGAERTDRKLSPREEAELIRDPLGSLI